MKKIFLLCIFFLAYYTPEGFAQIPENGSYLWNSTSITYSLNDKTELVLGNKDHYSSQINRLDYFHFELIGYRKLSKDFSLGMGLRQAESYKSEQWNPGQTYMLYGVYFLNPGNMKIRFANRLASKTYKFSETQYGLDNNTSVDFFVRSTNMLPKPYLADEVFTSLNTGKVHSIRLYGGFHVLQKKHFGIDLYYCYWTTRPVDDWKNYNVLGLSTKVRI